MADNYLEKRYRDVFGTGSGFDAETGYAEPRKSGSIIPKLPKIKKNGNEKKDCGADGSGCQR